MPAITINSTTVNVPEGANIAQAGELAGIDIPTLCYHKDLHPRGSCGMCIVAIDGVQGYKRACVTKVRDGMVVRTNTPEIRAIRKGLLELVLAAHPDDCLQCIKHGKCELQRLAERLEIRELRYEKYTRDLPVDRTSVSIIRDMNKCIGCGRCVDVCNEVQGVGSIFMQGRGSDTIVAPARGSSMGTSVCVNCGQCVVYCPVGALYEREELEDVWAAIDAPDTRVVAQIAPALRVALGEEFGMDAGEASIGKIYTALRKLGVDVVFDTNFSADLTIMEEGTELLQRLNAGAPLPLITSCSPGWIKFGETFFPDLLDNVSTCKSPQQMLGALIKSYYPQKQNLDKKSLVSLSIMPCTAKKYEAARAEMCDSGGRDVDYVLTTRELARMIRQAGIDFSNLEDGEPDRLLSAYSGAATIFGATGGVMEAALRTAYELKTGRALAKVEFAGVRGLDGVKTASVDVDGSEVRVAVAHGLGNARELLEYVRDARGRGELPFHFIEIMACTGGCVGGGGQPLENDIAARTRRARGLYAEDAGLAVRRSHENPEVKAIYSDYLGTPGGDKAHHLLHTGYVQRNPYA